MQRETTYDPVFDAQEHYRLLLDAMARPGKINTLPRLILSQGAVVIKDGDEVIGAIGASGAPGGEKDEACARAGLAKISDRLK